MPRQRRSTGRRRVGAAPRLLLTLALVGTGGLAACRQPVPMTAPAPRLQMAITVDDVPVHHSLPPGQTRTEVTRRVVAALDARGVPAYGFVNGGFVDSADTRGALAVWSQRYPIGNHTWIHDDIDKLSARRYEGQIARNEPILEQHSSDGDWHWFRYPYVREGASAKKRLAVRSFLHDRGYRIAAVTLDSTDYAYGEQYAICEGRKDTDGVAAMETDLLAAARANALASQQMSASLYNRQVPVVVLVHDGALDARVLPRMLEMFSVMGYEFIPLAQAQADPAYATDNDPSLPPQPVGWEAQMTAKGLVPPAPRPSEIDLDTICR